MTDSIVELLKQYPIDNPVYFGKVVGITVNGLPIYFDIGIATRLLKGIPDDTQVRTINRLALNSIIYYLRRNSEESAHKCCILQ